MVKRFVVLFVASWAGGMLGLVYADMVTDREILRVDDLGEAAGILLVLGAAAAVVAPFAMVVAMLVKLVMPEERLADRFLFPLSASAAFLIASRALFWFSDVMHI